MKKILDSSVALALVSGVLLSLGASLQAGLLNAYGLDFYQFGHLGPEALVFGFSTLLSTLVSPINVFMWHWQWTLAALAIVIAARFAHKRWTPLQKVFSAMMSPVRRHPWTSFVLSALFVYFVAQYHAYHSGVRAALIELNNVTVTYYPERPHFVVRSVLRLKAHPNEEIVGRLVAEANGTYAFYEIKGQRMWLVQMQDVQSITLTLNNFYSFRDY